MKIVKDEKKQINLHPLVIYFVLKGTESKDMVDVVKSMNKHKTFTRRVFKFEAIDEVGKHSAEVDGSLTSSIKGYNMFVRFVDATNDCYYYGVEKVDFSVNPNEVQQRIVDFVTNVCKQNVMHLQERLTKCDQEASGMAEHKTVLQQMQHEFRLASMVKSNKRGLLGRLMNNEVATPIVIAVEDGMDRVCYGRAMRMEKEAPIKKSPMDMEMYMFHTQMPQGFKDKFDKAAKDNNPQYMWEYMMSLLGAPDKETSDEIAKGYYNADYDYALKRDNMTRMKQGTKPEITIEVRKQVKKVLASGKKKMEYGIVITVDGMAYPFFFKGKDQTMAYVCTLLRCKMKERMFLHEFYNNGKGKRCKFSNRKCSAKWIGAVYDEIYPYDNKSADEWYSNINNKMGRPLNQGKSQCNAIINEVLAALPDASLYCNLDLRVDNLGDTYLSVDVDPKSIIIPKEMKFLISDFEELMS